MGLMVSGLIVAGVALAWALLGNLGGMVSFGHAAFFGVGAYTSAMLSAKAGLPVPLSLLAGGLGAALCSLVMLPALRLSGPYFALAILAYAHIFKILATEAELDHRRLGRLRRAFPILPTIAGIDFSSRIGSYCAARRAGRRLRRWSTAPSSAAMSAPRCAPWPRARTRPASSASTRPC